MGRAIVVRLSRRYALGYFSGGFGCSCSAARPRRVRTRRAVVPGCHRSEPTSSLSPPASTEQEWARSGAACGICGTCGATWSVSLPIFSWLAFRSLHPAMRPVHFRSRRLSPDQYLNLNSRPGMSKPDLLVCRAWRFEFKPSSRMSRLSHSCRWHPDGPHSQSDAVVTDTADTAGSVQSPSGAAASAPWRIRLRLRSSGLRAVGVLSLRTVRLARLSRDRNRRDEARR